MARKTENIATQEVRVPSQSEFLKLIKQFKDSQAELSEIKGRMGSTVEQGITNHDLHKDAFRVFMKYASKSDVQASNFMLHLTTYWEYGKLGEGGMFEEEEKKVAVEAVKKRGPGRPRKVVAVVEEPESIEGQGDARTREEELESVH